MIKLPSLNKFFRKGNTLSSASILFLNHDILFLNSFSMFELTAGT